MHRRLQAGVGLAVAVGVVITLQTAHAQADALALQRRAIARIDAVVDGYRRTGDIRLPVSELTQAGTELATSNRALAAASNWPALALGLTKQGHVHRMQAQWPQAVALYQQALDAATRGKDLVRQADALAWLGLAESSRTNLGDAFIAAQRATQIAGAAGDPEVLARALDVLAIVQIAQGNLTGAANTIERELVAAAKAEPLAPYYAYLNRSDVYLKVAGQCDTTQNFDACLQAVDRSRSDLQQSIAIARKLGYGGLVRQTEEMLSNVETRRKMVEMARGFAATTGALTAFQPRRASDVLVNDNFVATFDEVPKELIEALESSRDMERRFGAFADLARVRTRYTEGSVAEIRGDNVAALRLYLQALDLLERDRRSIHDDRGRTTFGGDRVGFYYSAVMQQLQQRLYADAFATFERSRARALSDLIATRRVSLARPQERELYAESASLRTQIAEAQQRLFELVSQADAGKAADRRAAIETRIRDLETRYRQVETRMANEAPRLTSLAEAKPATLAALQQVMRRERFEVLQYLVTASGIAAWHIGPDTITVRSVFLPRVQLTPKVARLQASLADRNAPFDQKTARELFLFLIQPVLAQVRGTRLVIIPHEDLTAVPFHVLENPADGRALGERFDISYAPSASILLELKPSAPLGNAQVYAVADPDIVAASGEVASIARLFPGRSRVVTDRLPNEAEVRTGVRGADVVHLSVHGKFNAAEPMLSYLNFAPAGSDDGRLTAAEMFGLELDNSRLVVLSACETGRIESTSGNETLGLVRALIYAGASTLVLSSWEVDSDATALWMRTFYETARTRPPAEAARTATVRVKNTAGYGHPYYWAAFAMVGR